MKTIEELKKFYDTEMMSDIVELESTRKSVVNKLLIIISIAAVLALIIIFLGLAAMCGGAFVLALIIFLIICIPGYYFTTKHYTSDFKDRVINNIIKFIDPNLRYYKDCSISEQAYIASRLFLKEPDRYEGDDYVSGIIGKTSIEFSELHTEYKTVSVDDKGHRTENWHTIFKGLFFAADFNKHFKGVTVVLPDTAERLLGGFIGKMLQKANFTRGQLIKLEDVEFEKYFAVYGDDQVEARYILSTSLMKRIMDFKKKTNKTIHLSFADSKIFLAISYDKNLFEPKVFKTLLDFSQIQEYFEDLKLVLDIVEDLNLNTRIWTKN